MSINRFAGLQSNLSKVGRDFDSVVRSSKAIFLFGSRAMDVATDKSDWDLLCISNDRSIRSQHVDLVCVAPGRARSVNWLGSELASHVSRFGYLLHGDSSWMERVAISDRAICKKREKIARRISIVHPWWNDFTFEVKQKHFRLLRNDISRLNYLIKRQPIPPTSLLESTSVDNYLKLIYELGKADWLSQQCVSQLNSIAD